jgi:uncharacterized protein (DUF1499 family)
MKKNIWKRTMQILGFGIICIMAFFSHRGNKSQEMKFISTLNESSLGKCGVKPNCISSFHSESEEHYLAGHILSKSPLKQVDDFFKDCSQKITKENYRHYECQSNLFKFVDDIEVLYLKDKGQLHFRSASRVGHSDMGANRKRILNLLDHLK